MSSITYIGMDVHSTSFTFCALKPNTSGQDQVFANVNAKPDYKEVVKYINMLKEQRGRDSRFIYYLATYEHLTAKLNAMDARIEELAAQKRYAGDVKKLCRFLGIKTAYALSLIVETGDFRRFAKGDLYSAYLGLTPSEHSSGEKVVEGGSPKRETPIFDDY